METIERVALEFAIIKHADQRRKNSGHPYVVHPIRVAALVRELCGVQKSRESGLYIAALLHDTLEDTDTTQEEIVAQFGHAVAMLVEAVTSDKEKIKSVGKTAYLRDKINFMSNDALLLKLCDRLDNISDLKPGYSNDKWSTEYAQQTYSIFHDQVALMQDENGDDKLPLKTALFRICQTLNRLGYHDSFWDKPFLQTLIRVW